MIGLSDFMLFNPGVDAPATLPNAMLTTIIALKVLTLSQFPLGTCIQLVFKFST